ncbi:MAG: DUF72 domain-containing protein [Anaerolineae bacterium]|nr:DUF72 domain-containing protein [Anaerolineae bacterium]
MRTHPIFVGCTGWSIPRPYADRFPGSGTLLERYARLFPAVEIASSFYRSHRPQTYTRWAELTPPAFRFAVKVPRLVTHFERLRNPAPLTRFHQETAALGAKLGPWLVQLPPSLRFEAGVAADFFTALRQEFDGDVVCEPRHPTWFTAEAEALLRRFRIARVTTDPVYGPGGDRPGGWPEPVYIRLHGSPELYASAYDDAFLADLAARLRTYAQTATVWCFFNNTALGHAIANALTVLGYLGWKW